MRAGPKLSDVRTMAVVQVETSRRLPAILVVIQRRVSDHGEGMLNDYVYLSNN